MSRKGITPIIAAVLLVAVSLSVVAIFSGWAPNLAKTITDDTTNSTLETLECDQASVDIRSAYYNTSSSPNNLTVTLRNNGGTDLSKMIVAVFDQNDLTIEENQDVNLSSGELNDTVINGVDKEPSYVEAYSTQCGKVKARLDDITR